MIAKLIVWAPSRAHAILRMRRALEEYRVVGVQTNIPFHLGVMQSLDFQRGRLDTKFVERFLGNTGRMSASGEDKQMLETVSAMAGALVTDRKRLAGSAASTNGAANSSQANDESMQSAWRLAGRRTGLR
jgi:acetyl-CoA carboxylase biotin carboxylase subunit